MLYYHRKQIFGLYNFISGVWESELNMEYKILSLHALDEIELNKRIWKQQQQRTNKKHSIDENKHKFYTKLTLRFYMSQVL